MRGEAALCVLAPDNYALNVVSSKTVHHRTKLINRLCDDEIGLFTRCDSAVCGIQSHGISAVDGGGVDDFVGCHTHVDTGQTIDEIHIAARCAPRIVIGGQCQR